ncbi:hypothetical protein M7I_2405 [Glarea lozoyensis 74030]|uniref:Uncharacterized protein n=1 Tax=Glarea lozoyensis (strain ATCC 74030 / MF5533) TaxID=1104152 RepID=H0EIP3_GLAL7|nr:hypothetical protein M7I_2405 [Glarea lozoyensis 74030]
MCTTTIVGNIAIAIISVEIAAGICFLLWKYIQQRRNAKAETGSQNSSILLTFERSKPKAVYNHANKQPRLRPRTSQCGYNQTSNFLSSSRCTSSRPPLLPSSFPSNTPTLQPSTPPPFSPSQFITLPHPSPLPISL